VGSRTARILESGRTVMQRELRAIMADASSALTAQAPDSAQPGSPSRPCSSCSRKRCRRSCGMRQAGRPRKTRGGWGLGVEQAQARGSKFRGS
jgi:hypothetical protein